MSPELVALLVLSLSAENVIGTTSNSTLSHSAFLDADNKYHVAWDFDDQYITFEIFGKTRGYVGLGFSPNGDMPASDIVISWVDDSTGTGEISDRHAEDRSKPLVDRSEDYTLIASYQNDSHTVVKFRRKLDLPGDEDYSIKDETVRVIWAYNDADPTPDGTIKYHGTNRGNKNMYLLNPQRKKPAMPDNVVYMDFLNPNITIPTHHTTYWCQSFHVPQLDRKHHVIKIEPVIQPGHESEVHHILLYACYHDVSGESFHKGHACYHPNMPDDFRDCTSTILAWAVGGGPMYLPENVGLPFGYEGDPKMLLMETHYDNPTGKEGLEDASGLRILLTPDLREHDGGILEIGEVVGPTQIIPPYSEAFRTSGYCYPECLSQDRISIRVSELFVREWPARVMAAYWSHGYEKQWQAMESHPKGIKVFATHLHSHLLGRAMRVRHFRGGVERPVMSQDNNYDFNYQDFRMLRNETEILPGDYVVAECDYRSTGRTEVTYGGLSTRHEMCLAFLMYYPKIKLANCQSTPVPQYVATFLSVSISDNRVITSPGEFAGRGLYEVLHTEVDWSSKLVRDKFQDLVEKEGVDGFYVRCIDGDFDYPVNGKVMSLPKKNSTAPSGSFRASVTGLFAFLVVGSVVMT